MTIDNGGLYAAGLVVAAAGCFAAWRPVPGETARRWLRDRRLPMTAAATNIASAHLARHRRSTVGGAAGGLVLGVIFGLIEPMRWPLLLAVPCAPLGAIVGQLWVPHDQRCDRSDGRRSRTPPIEPAPAGIVWVRRSLPIVTLVVGVVSTAVFVASRPFSGSDLPDLGPLVAVMLVAYATAVNACLAVGVELAARHARALGVPSRADAPPEVYAAARASGVGAAEAATLTLGAIILAPVASIAVWGFTSEDTANTVTIAAMAAFALPAVIVWRRIGPARSGGAAAV